MDTSYEIYVRQKGSDRWMLDSRYGTSDKQEAVDDAKELERQPHIEAVRVVREIHNPETNTSRETVVYTTSGLKKAAPEAKRRDDDDDDDMPPPPPTRRPAPARADPSPAAEEEADEEEAPKSGWFKRKPKAEQGDKPVARGRSGVRAYMVIVKFVVIVMVSFGLATVTTVVYQRFLA